LKEKFSLQRPAGGSRAFFPFAPFIGKYILFGDNYFPSDSPPIFTKFAAMK
jgi:hypothetical protein